MADTTYRIEIDIVAHDRASREMSKVHSTMGQIMRIATSFIIARFFYGVTEAIGGVVGGAVEAYESLQLVEFGLESLYAQQLSQGQEVVKQSQIVKTISESERQAIAAKKDELTLLNAELAEQYRLQQVNAERYGAGDFRALRYDSKIAEIQDEIQAAQSFITNLEQSEGKLITVTETTREGVLAIGEALKLSVGPAQQLSDWIIKLGLSTPFSEASVLNVLRTAAAFDITLTAAKELATVEEQLDYARKNNLVTAQRITTALIDYGAATGRTGDQLEMIALAIGQINSAGTLLGQDARQLITAGLGINVLAAAMGMTTEEFQRMRAEGTILSDELLPKLLTYLEEGFGGSGERALTTLVGIKSGFESLRAILGRAIVSPFLDQVTLQLKGLLDYLSEPEQLRKFERFGERLGAAYEKISTTVGGVFDLIRNPPSFHDIGQSFYLKALGEPSEWKKAIENALGDAFTAIDSRTFAKNLGFEIPGFTLADGLDNIGKGAGITALITLGLKAMPAIVWGLKFISKINLPALLAGAGIAALLTAWEGNFGGIQEKVAAARDEFNNLKTDIGNFYDEVLAPEIKAFIENIVTPAVVSALDYITLELLPNTATELGNIKDFLVKIKENGITWESVFNILGIDTSVTDVETRLEELKTKANETYEEIFGVEPPPNWIDDFFTFPEPDTSRLEGIGEKFKDAFTRAAYIDPNTVNKIKDSFTRLFTSIYDNAIFPFIQIIGRIATIISILFGKFLDSKFASDAEAFFGNLGRVLKLNIVDNLEFANAAWVGFVGWLGKARDTLEQGVLEALKSLGEKLEFVRGVLDYLIALLLGTETPSVSLPIPSLGLLDDVIPQGTINFPGTGGGSGGGSFPGTEDIPGLYARTNPVQVASVKVTNINNFNTRTSRDALAAARTVRNDTYSRVREFAGGTA